MGADAELWALERSACLVPQDRAQLLDFATLRVIVLLFVSGVLFAVVRFFEHMFRHEMCARSFLCAIYHSAFGTPYVSNL